jgi:hypothetical protein
MKKCKMCDNELTKPWQDTYCSNGCKHSDPELNAKRARTDKNDPAKRLKCNLCDYITKDVVNLGGHATSHLRNVHKIYDENYSNHYTITEAIKKETVTCPICNDWSTIDLQNKSGWFTVHILSHSITIEDFLKKYPKYESMIKKQSGILQKEKSLQDKNNSIECKICGEKFYKLSNTHLVKHNITPDQYKQKYNQIAIRQI